MAGISLKLVGIEALLKRLDPKDFKKPINQGLKEITQLAQRETAIATPRITSRLASNILQPIQFGEGFAQYGTNVEYASIVEFGSEKMRARHIEGGVRVYGEGMFSYALRKLTDKMDGLLGNIATAIEKRYPKNP